MNYGIAIGRLQEQVKSLGDGLEQLQEQAAKQVEQLQQQVASLRRLMYFLGTVIVAIIAIIFVDKYQDSSSPGGIHLLYRL